MLVIIEFSRCIGTYSSAKFELIKEDGISSQCSDYSYKADDYMVLGNFDTLEIIPVDSFRKYHDVSLFARNYLGRRQSILLYCIEDSSCQPCIVYDTEKKYWCDETKTPIINNFLCISLLSITNEVHSKVTIFALLPKLRRKILEFIDKFNNKLKKEEDRKLKCEVYGALNSTEICLIWLCNQYVDVLNFIDKLKHTKLEFTENDNLISIPLFLASNTTVAVKEDIFHIKTENDGKPSGAEDSPLGDQDLLKSIEGNANVRISFHDGLKKRSEMQTLITSIKNFIPEGHTFEVFYSSGEYDLILHMQTCDALRILNNQDMLGDAKRKQDNTFKKELREILRNNTQLLLKGAELEDQVPAEDQKFIFNIREPNSDFIYTAEVPANKDWLELVDLNSPYIKSYMNSPGSIEKDNYVINNYSYYAEIRKDMKDLIEPTAGVIDMLDLIYTDYLSTIASSYNKIWVSDFHKQFKAILHAINLWIKQQTSEKITSKDDWNQFRDLTNAFKQQVYHLSQSSRMVLRVPHCHFRVTSQYDLLIHAYYGFTKKILEIIYLTPLYNFFEKAYISV